MQSATTEIRPGKKERKKKEDRNHRTKMLCPHLLCRAAIITVFYYLLYNENWNVGQ